MKCPAILIQMMLDFHVHESGNVKYTTNPFKIRPYQSTRIGKKHYNLTLTNPSLLYVESWCANPSMTHAKRYYEYHSRRRYYQAAPSFMGYLYGSRCFFIVTHVCLYTCEKSSTNTLWDITVCQSEDQHNLNLTTIDRKSVV